MKYRRRCNAFHFDEDPLDDKAEGLSKIYHEIFLLLKFLQTKPLFKNMRNK